MARMSLPTPTLHTPRLHLRRVTSADAEALFALHSSASVLRYWDAPAWTDRARAQGFIAACARLAEEGSGARVAVDRGSDGTFIGWCCLTRWNPDFRSAAMGYCLSDAAWGHGYATEAARALLQWGFDSLDLNRVQRRPTLATGHPLASWRSSVSSGKGRCGRTASSTAWCPTRGSMDCSGGSGRRRRTRARPVTPTMGQRCSGPAGRERGPRDAAVLGPGGGLGHARRSRRAAPPARSSGSATERRWPADRTGAREAPRLPTTSRAGVARWLRGPFVPA